MCFLHAVNQEQGDNNAFYVYVNVYGGWVVMRQDFAVYMRKRETRGIKLEEGKGDQKSENKGVVWFLGEDTS